MRQMVMFTAFNRPEYMRETLASWSRVRDVSDTVFDFHIEPSYIQPEMEQVCRSAIFTEPVLHVNRGQQGVQRNPFNALNCGFSRPGGREHFKPDDFVILAEDDFVVSTDILEWFSWARREFYGDEHVLCVSSTQHEEQPGGLPQSLRIPWFPGWVWGTWRDRWENLIAPDWTFEYEHRGWDWRLTDYWCKEKGMTCVVPAVSRSQHIGEYLGVHTIPGEWFREQQSRCFVSEIAPQEYQRPVGISYVPNPRG